MPSATIAAIRAVQKTFMSFPDGLVEPGKKTIRALQAMAGVAALPAFVPPPAPAAAPPEPASAATSLSFPGARVALVVRGKTGPAHSPGVMEQHADCILPNGAPVGFFGDGPGGSGASAGMNLSGVMADYSWFLSHRPHYVTLAIAKKYGVVSTVLTVEVSAVEAGAFAGYWSALALSPGTFHILGNNCSTHASDAFVTAGILPGGIPGLDTPNNLYNQLVAAKGGTAKSFSGFVGFTPGVGAGFGVEVL